ncbi:hypothetical protein ACVRZR_06510 [Streptococcus entericus]|uniref:hypothetical protein n=1 Tax=Streptococcus entericus TaxID=155680 RepID=UPI00037714E3|nr:hypothetical protein [Streptococcus entericus]
MFIIATQVVKGGGVKEKLELTICSKSGSGGRQVFGIALLADNQLVRLPVYPFVTHEERLDALEEFVTLYKSKLLEFYSKGHPTDFAHFLYGFNTKRKDEFRAEWFKKGVLIY